MFLLIGIANVKIQRILKFSNFESKITTTTTKKGEINIDCCRKSKLDSNYSASQALSKNT